MNRTIESLGKTNKIFLKKTFGFKTITQAKKAFGVSNEQEAYDVMRQMYNEKIEQEKEIKKKQQSEKLKKIRKQVKTSKLKFLNVLEQLENRKKLYTVAITVREMKTFNELSNKEKTYKTSNVFQKTYLASNETDLEDKINDDLGAQYPYDDSHVVVTTEGYSYSISETKNHNITAIDVPMKRGKPVKASFLKFAENIDPISYEDFKGECVLQMLLKYMDIKKEKTLVADFNEASLSLYETPYNKKNGITSRMILYICRQRNISCLGFDQRDTNFVKFTADHNKKRKFRPIVFYMFMSHFYLITDQKTILSLSASFRQNNNVFHSSLEVGENSNSIEELNFYSNLPLAECLELPKNSVVIFDKTDLTEELREYIKLTNNIPLVKNNTITQVGKISFGDNIQLVISGSLSEGIEWDKVHTLCNKAEIKFNNQSLGQLICQIRDKFFIIKRAKFTKEQREQIKHEQEDKCIKCKIVLTEKYHIDHIQPLANGGTNDKENLQALCVSCHIEKSREEKEACEYIQTDNITSAFNIQALNAVESNWFRKVAFSQPIGNIDGNLFSRSGKFSKDMNKCRRNILLNYGCDFPRYSVLDDIEKFDGKLETGFYYLETDNTFPLRKNGFYSYPIVSYCLKENIINTSDIKYQFKSSFKIEADYFNGFVEHLDAIFEDDVFLKKLAINSLVGLFGRRKNVFVENRICDRNEIDDIACAYQEFYKPYLNIINDDIVQVAGQSEVKKIESTFPIHAQILDCEAVELHKLVNKIKDHGGIPYEVKTDAVNYYANEHIDFDKPILKVIKNTDIRVRQRKDGVFVKEQIIRDEQGNIINKIVTNHATREDTDEKIIVKIEPRNQADNYWENEYKLPKYKNEEAKDLIKAVFINNDEKYELNEFYYKTIEESDDYSKLAENIVKSNKGCLILGPAGTGKTYLINEIKKQLENMEAKFKCVAPTNKATLLMNGETLHKFSYSLLNSKKQLKKYKSIKYLMVDEISMVQEIFYQVFMMLKHYNPELKLIIVGDFGQLPPVNDRVNRNYKKSRALYELVDGNKLELTKCKRSDDTHFKNCMNVRNGLPINLDKFEKKENTYLNICFTNETRKTINQECMERFLKETKPDKVIKFEALQYDKNSQALSICQSMPIIARVNSKSLDVVNNEMFVIKKINDDLITISNEMKKDIEIPTDKFNKLFYLAFCITIHKSQGATFENKYTIFEWNKQNKKMKYVALSRATDEKNIQIVP